MIVVALTARQQQVLDFVRLFQATNGYAPTRKEIADRFGFVSVNASDQHLRALEAHGALRLVPKIARGIVLSGKDEKPQEKH